MKRLVFVPFLALAACDGGIPDFRNFGGAPAVEVPAKERLASAIEANGCVVNAGNIGTILTEAAVPSAESEALLTALATEGRLADGGDETLRLTAAACA